MAASASNASPFAYPTGLCNRPTPSRSDGPSDGIALPISAHTSAAPRVAASRLATVRVVRVPSEHNARPTTKNPAYAMPLFSADHEWSPATDQAIEIPAHATRPARPATATLTGPSITGRPTAPRLRAARHKAASTTAAPPTQSTFESPESPPKNTAPSTRQALRSDRAPATGPLVRAAPSIRGHATTLSGCPVRARFRPRRAGHGRSGHVGSPNRRPYKSFTLLVPSAQGQPGDSLQCRVRLPHHDRL